MIHVQVAGYAGEGKSQVIRIIEEALRNAGKRVVTAETDKTTVAFHGTADVVISEMQLARSTMSVDDKKFDFLIGRTESEAYELIQDFDYIARVVSRNGIPMVGTRDVRTNRINLAVLNNIVVAWSIG